ncbi:MAG: Translation elongation factor EFTs/EF1B dimerization [Chloroflexi bacterium]|nr:Translation elongation factor EFTs/EF1B dimerization [Chloroflexota bacterium]
MDISAEKVRELRDATGAGVMDCKRALTSANGSIDKAVALLREQGLAQAAKRAGREAEQGIVESYIHGGGRIGVLVEVNCETDFVARTSAFRDLAHDLAMQIAATNPSSVGEASADGRLTPDEAGAEQLPLMRQPYIKNPSQTVADLVRETAAKTGENVIVRRFTRFELGN